MSATEQLPPDLISLIAETLVLDSGAIKPSSRLVDDLNMDSVAALDLLCAIQRAYDIFMPVQELRHIRTVQDIVDTVAALKNNTERGGRR
jgi:acyl carrier protein